MGLDPGNRPPVLGPRGHRSGLRRGRRHRRGQPRHVVPDDPPRRAASCPTSSTRRRARRSAAPGYRVGWTRTHARVPPGLGRLQAASGPPRVQEPVDAQGLSALPRDRADRAPADAVASSPTRRPCWPPRAPPGVPDGAVLELRGAGRRSPRRSRARSGSRAPSRPSSALEAGAAGAVVLMDPPARDARQLLDRGVRGGRGHRRRRRRRCPRSGAPCARTSRPPVGPAASGRARPRCRSRWRPAADADPALADRLGLPHARGARALARAVRGRRRSGAAPAACGSGVAPSRCRSRTRSGCPRRCGHGCGRGSVRRSRHRRGRRSSRGCGARCDAWRCGGECVPPPSPRARRGTERPRRVP